MDDSSNICLSCGLCCDGTLIGFVELDNEELPAVKKLMDIEDENGNGFFLQPCSNYCDGCTIYANRPKQCVKFKCELLTSVEEKELAFNLAVDMVLVVKQRKASLEKRIALLKLELQSPSFYFRMVELKKLLINCKSESALSEIHLELLSDLAELDSLVLKGFGVSLN
tara:strand:+ start:389 stop:892 length:504 start_codon:yes stop_codon:yes gene_type:complete